MFKFICKKPFYSFIRIAGFLLLIFYFVTHQNFEFSMMWAFLYPVIALSLAIILVHANLNHAFPWLDCYYCNKFRNTENNGDDDYLVSKVNYSLSLAKNKSSWLFLSTEDGVAFVPALLIGLSPLTALMSGGVFAFLHIGNNSYHECIAKFIIFTIIALIILPHGILTLIAGHYINDIIGVIALKYVSKYLLNKSLNQDGNKTRAC